MFEIRKGLCGLCLIGKIVPEHCTTIPTPGPASVKSHHPGLTAGRSNSFSL